ncbi:putative extracellular serine-rich [Diaporthe ampelina]|uniref:Putative extracellular serine-rich n=1 Tax=Diaporthe ampelina TaxID=1214573 RepID=A0A0G2FMP1_9PEZI|nr:putative extracellular serine-rich [Diaporthe ampelina]
MRQLVLSICLALAAARLSLAVDFVVNSQPWPLAPSSTPNNKVIPVLVGGTALTFTPNSVTASPGDILQFQFAARNHTVTQSLPNSPCRPVEAGAAGVPGAAAAPGIHSGFIPFDGGASGMVGTFNVPVMNTQPMFLYCAQAMHCQQGMVMTVNA